MDAFNSLHSVTFEIDEAHGTAYHQRFVDFVTMAQQRGYVIGGAMTDVKGDRSKAPHEQEDPDLYRARDADAPRRASTSAAPKRTRPVASIRTGWS